LVRAGSVADRSSIKPREASGFDMNESDRLLWLMASIESIPSRKVSGHVVAAVLGVGRGLVRASALCEWQLFQFRLPISFAVQH